MILPTIFSFCSETQETVFENPHRKEDNPHDPVSRQHAKLPLLHDQHNDLKQGPDGLRLSENYGRPFSEVAYSPPCCGIQILEVASSVFWRQSQCRLVYVNDGKLVGIVG